MTNRRPLVLVSGTVQEMPSGDVVDPAAVQGQGFYTGAVPSGSTTATVTHGLGTTSVDVTVRDSSGNEVQVPNQAASTNTVVLTFTTAPTAGQYTAVVQAGASTPVALATAAPSPIASTAAVGTSSSAARADHVHAPQAPATLAYAATVTTDASQGNLFRITLTGNLTLANPTNPVDGQKVVWELVQDATGSRTLTLGSAFALGTDISAVTLTTTASKRDFVGAVYNAAAAKWYVIAFSKGY